MLSTWGSWLKGAAVWIACAGMIMPPDAWATDGQSANLSASSTTDPALAAVQDVALQPGGVLEGKVVDAQGNPVPDAPVSVRQQQDEIAKLTTTQDGSFHVSGVRGGVYRLVTFQGDGVYRAWPAGTAPPSALPRAVIRNVQFMGPGGAFRDFITSPWTIGAIIATAIAVPVALANRDHGSSS